MHKRKEADKEKKGKEEHYAGHTLDDTEPDWSEPQLCRQRLFVQILHYCVVSVRFYTAPNPTRSLNT